MDVEVVGSIHRAALTPAELLHRVSFSAEVRVIDSPFEALVNLCIGRGPVEERRPSM